MRAGFAAIIGAPNVGKSTFLNQALGFKLAITSDKPQTTRHRLLGVYQPPEDSGAQPCQIAFLDTPGLHQHKGALNQFMNQTALGVLDEVDAVLFLMEATDRGLAQGHKVSRLLSGRGLPVVVGLNKVDRIADKKRLLPMLAQVCTWGDWRAVVPVSALKSEGLADLLDQLAQCMPEGPALFPPDHLTDLSMRFLAAELIREKVFRLTSREVPYSTAVTVDQFLEPSEEGGSTAITATIHLERESQKGIVIGKGGAMIKKIGSQARLDLEELVGGPVFLDLHVRVEPKWSQSTKGLNKLGYRI